MMDVMNTDWFWIAILIILLAGDIGEFLVSSAVIWVLCQVFDLTFQWEWAIGFYFLLWLINWVNGKRR